MTITLNQASLLELCEQAQQQGEQLHRQTEIASETSLPQQVGCGKDRITNLRGGLTVHIREARLWETTKIEQWHEPVFPITAKFYLSGSSRVQTQDVPGIPPDYEEVKGCHYLYYLPELSETEEWRSHELIRVVMVYANVDYFRSLNLACDNSSSAFQKAICGDDRQFHQPLGKITSAMTQALQQILHCPYQGLTQQLYLESKALELLSLQLAVWQNGVPASGQLKLHAADIERLHHAREILMQRWTDPPSLTELACQVGLNDRKLKQGFRQVFGNTVFGYLQDYRMQQAKQLLHQTQLTIAAVAATVGYKDPEAFSTAFRRKFAVSPKTYQLEQQFN